MKKILFTLVLTLLALAEMQLPTQAAEQKSSGDVTYKIVTLKNGAREVHVTGFVTMKNHLVIPATIEGLPVVEIVDRAFYLDRSDYASDGTYDEHDLPGYKRLFMTSVRLPNTLKRIGNEAFFNHRIKRLTLPPNLTEIGYRAFASNDLISITIPKSVQKIGGNIVQGNPVKTYALPPQFKKPQAKQFGHLLYVIFTRNGTKEVRITGHTYKTAQTKIIVPKTINKMPVTEIGDYAFSTRSSLLGLETSFPLIKEVALPSTIRKIGDHALSGVHSDTNKKRSFSLPQDLEFIGDYAFAHNGITNQGKDFQFPQKLKSIGDGAFQWNNLQSITIPVNVKTIGQEIFAYNDLTTVTFGNGVKSIPAGAFRGNHITHLTLPKDLTSIGAGAFFSNQLPRLLLPSTVQSVGDYAFAYNQLLEVNLQNNVQTLGDGAFVHNQLTNFSVPRSIKEMPFNALLMNPLQTIKIQGAQTKIVDYMATYKTYTNSYYNVHDHVDKLFTDEQRMNTWTNWNQVVPARTTLYIKWHEHRF